MAAGLLDRCEPEIVILVAGASPHLRHPGARRHRPARTGPVRRRRRRPRLPADRRRPATAPLIPQPLTEIYRRVHSAPPCVRAVPRVNGVPLVQC
jgi:hypothetical protein